MGAKRRKRPTKTRTRNIVAAERRAQAVALRREGKTFAEIGAAIGFSPQRAHKIVTDKMDELNALLVDDTAALRQQQLDTIGALKEALYAGAKSGELAKVDRLVKLLERESKLAGLDAPDKTEFGGPGGGPIPVAAPAARSPIIWIPPEDKDDDGSGGAPPAPTAGG